MKRKSELPTWARGHTISAAIAEQIMGWTEHDGRWLDTDYRVATNVMHLPENGYWRPDRDYKHGLLVMRQLKKDHTAKHEYFHEKGKIRCEITTGSVTAKAECVWDLNSGNEMLCDAALAFHKQMNQEVRD